MGEEGHILLPAASHSGVKSVEEALLERRSIREYSPEAISLAELAQLLWSAQGVTGAEVLGMSTWKSDILPRMSTFRLERLV